LLDPLLGESRGQTHGETNHVVAPTGLNPLLHGAKEEAS
jgi:hypothetical protein